MLRGEFIDGSSGRLFCTLRLPNEASNGAVIVVPAFGDEMNKTRRMVAETAIQLNACGIAVLCPDLSGTGDSEGRFVDADWNSWIVDLTLVHDWACRAGIRVDGLLGIRTGALLACEFANACASLHLQRTVFWQPVTSGSTFVKQMLRLRAMANAVGSGIRESVDELTRRISRGEVVRAGGYDLTNRVVARLMTASLADLVSEKMGRLYSVEVTRLPEKVGASTEWLGSCRVDASRYLGDPFWSATEIICDTNVVARTVAALQERMCDH